MNRIEANRLELALRETLGIDEAQTKCADAIVKELMKIRLMNPHAFQAGLMLVMSTLLAVGDQQIGTSAADLATRLERCTTLQREISALLVQSQEAALTRVLEQFGLDEEDLLSKSKVN